MLEYEEKELVLDGCNKKYLISNYGQIFDAETHRERILQVHHKGYLKCMFKINGKPQGKFIHRLVLMTFQPVENMQNLLVDHIDGDKKNNRLDNLEWVTNAENTRRAIANGLWENCFPSGDRSHHHILTEEEVSQIKYLLHIGGYSQRLLGEMFDISPSTINAINKGRMWKEVEMKEFDITSVL